MARSASILRSDGYPIPSNKGTFSLRYLLYILYTVNLMVGPTLGYPRSHESNSFSLRKSFEEITSSSVEVAEPSIEELQTKQLLRTFGLTSLPHPTVNPMDRAPTFMLNLYDELTESAENSDSNTKNQLTANTVRCYYEAETDRGRRNIYEFDVSGVLPRETVVAAELRLFKLRPGEEIMREANNTLPSYIQVLQWPDIYSVNSTDKPSKDVLDGKFVSVDYKGLVQFNVTSAFKNFAAQEGDQTQKAFRVKIKDYFEEEYNMKRTVKFAKHAKNEERRPLLVLFLHDSAIARSNIAVPTASTSHIRRRRDSPITKKNAVSNFLRNSRRLGDLETHNRETRSTRKYRSRKKGKNKNKCQLYDFEVDFAKIGWAEWILAPTGYRANYCDGYCPFPLDEHFNATNHATVQIIVHTKQKVLPNPCCVPHSFDNIHVLYLDEISNVVLKEFDDMVATACGCH